MMQTFISDFVTFTKSINFMNFDVLLLQLWKINCVISDMLLPKTTFYKNKLEVKSRKNCKNKHKDRQTDK